MSEVGAGDCRRYVKTLTPQAVEVGGLKSRTATVSHFGYNVARRLGMTSAELQKQFDDLPFITSMMSTHYGDVGVITIPMTYVEMVRDRAGALRYARIALECAQRMGARRVSLAGLLASATDYGAALDAPAGYVTTGHATTASAIIKTVAAALTLGRRAWPSEVVTVLGVGSIGRATISAALATLGAPRRLILADLISKEPAVRELGDLLRVDNPSLDVSFANAANMPNPLYEASLIIGCTSTPNVLQVARLRPGCIIVDDSVPHCFDVVKAFDRIRATMDLLLANGGLLTLPRRMSVESYAPSLLHERLDWRVGLDSWDSITSCVLSPLLMELEPTLSPTLGIDVPTSSVLANLAVLEKLRITAPPALCAGRSPTGPYVTRFAERFGQVETTGR